MTTTSIESERILPDDGTDAKRVTFLLVMCAV